MALRAGRIAHGSNGQIYVSTSDRNSGRTVSEANVKVGAIPDRYKGRSCDNPSVYPAKQYPLTRHLSPILRDAYLYQSKYICVYLNSFLVDARW